MKTICIFDQCGESDIIFIVLQGDHSKYDRVYIGEGTQISEELYDIIYDPSGISKEDIIKFNSFDECKYALEDKVIVIGFYP